MNPLVATLMFVCGVLGLFWLDRDVKGRASGALWLPMIWLAIGGSRLVSEWLYPAAATTSGAYIEGNPIDQTVQTVLMVIALVVLVGRRGKVWQLLRANAPVLLFFLYCGASILWSDYPEVSVRRWIKAIGDLVMVLIVLTDRDRLAAQKLPVRVGFLLIPASILLMKYYPEFARGFDDITGEPTYTGVTTSKNSLGMICLIFGLGFVWRFLAAYSSVEHRGRTGKLMANGVAIAMVVWLFMRAHSMTSLACFLVAIGLIIATGFPLARRMSVVHLLVSSVLLVCVAVLFLGAGGGVLGMMGRDSSLTGRTAIWQKILAIADHPWLGTGYESFWLGDRLRTIAATYHGINQAHNGYIEIFLNLGWIGVLLLGVVLATGYRNIVVAFRRDRGAAQLRLAYFVVGIVMNFTEASFKMMSPVWLLFLLAIMAIPRAPVLKTLHAVDESQADTAGEFEPRVAPILRLEEA
jgi:O-antigen ligase